MADSATLRVQRHRRHSAGDHSICRPGRCPVAGRALNSPALGMGIEAADLDPVVELRKSAARLISVCEQDPGNVVAAKELRAHLALIPAGESGSPLDVIRRRAMVKTFGWSSDDPDLLALARSMFMDDPMPFLRSMADEVP